MEHANNDLMVDSDAHVVESARTWDFMDPSEKQFKPIPLETREEAGVKLQFWLIDGKVRGLRFPAFSQTELERRAQQVGRKFADSQESRELGNVGLRIDYMDRNNVDVQGLHNTIFIEPCTERAAVDAVLGPATSGWAGGTRNPRTEGHVARGGHEARSRRDLLLGIALGILLGIAVARTLDERPEVGCIAARREHDAWPVPVQLA